ncbi:flagellar type III secretion system pore protein FliP [Celeribacter sp.]|uniref:flagellar type III secretion system pore protein FliP n=1 Tax=Celeribacter sp. TaxID=1890673 RepID=UPI003A94088E
MRLSFRSIGMLLVLAFLLSTTANSVSAQDLSISFGDAETLTARSIQLIALVTLLSIVPGLAVMITCFPFIVTVLSILRQAIGLQQSPPNMMIVSLALFLTYFVMDPVLTESWTRGIEPLMNGQIDLETAFVNALEPFRVFMSGRVSEDTYYHLAELRAAPEFIEPVTAKTSLSLLVPSFLLSEIERAFQIGFLVFLPFLIIDLVVSAILMSMGMMMVPPAIVSLPFKLAFFVVSDGWTLLSGALVRSYF